MLSLQRKRLLLNVTLLLGVAALLILGIPKMQKDNEAKSEYVNTLYEESIGDEVTQLMINHEKLDKPLVINKQSGDQELWQLGDKAVNATIIQQLFTLLSEQYQQAYEPNDELIERFGFRNSKMSIQFNQIRYVYGKLNGLSFKRYILIQINLDKELSDPDNKIVLIPETISHILMAAPESLFQEKVKPHLYPVNK